MVRGKQARSSHMKAQKLNNTVSNNCTQNKPLERLIHHIHNNLWQPMKKREWLNYYIPNCIMSRINCNDIFSQLQRPFWHLVCGHNRSKIWGRLSVRRGISDSCEWDDAIPISWTVIEWDGFNICPLGRLCIFSETHCWRNGLLVCGNVFLTRLIS